MSVRQNKMDAIVSFFISYYLIKSIMSKTHIPFFIVHAAVLTNPSPPQRTWVTGNRHCFVALLSGWRPGPLKIGRGANIQHLPLGTRGTDMSWSGRPLNQICISDIFWSQCVEKGLFWVINAMPTWDLQDSNIGKTPNLILYILGPSFI